MQQACKRRKNLAETHCRKNNELEIKKQELKSIQMLKKAEADADTLGQQQRNRETIEITTADANIAKLYMIELRIGKRSLLRKNT